jgi:hypothetical protein
VDLVPMVIRPGYVYVNAGGEVIVYQAVDSFHPEFGDYDPNMLMELKPGC